MVRIPHSHHKLLEGQQFTVNRSAQIQTNDTANLWIQNPEKSRKTLVVDTLVVRVDSAAVGKYYQDPDASGGSVTWSTNDLIGGGKSTVAKVRQDVEFSNFRVSTQFPLSAADNTGKGFSERPPVALAEGATLGIEVTSREDTNDILILATFYETDRSASHVR